MIALVTGASGFIGSHLVDALRAAGHEVRVLKRPLPPDDMLHRDPLWDGVTHLFHLAARTRAPDSAAFREANVDFTARLVRAAEVQPTPPRFLFVSSLAASGPAPSRDEPRDEMDAPAPIERYGASKLDAEQVVRAAACPWTIVRPPAVYGPRDRDFLTVFRQVRAPVHLRATPGWHAFTLTHVHDVVAALITVAQHDDATGALYHIGGETCSWDRFYDTVQQVMPRRSRRGSIPIVIPAPLVRVAGVMGGLWARYTGYTPLASPDKIALGEAPWWLASGTRLMLATGWQPHVRLDEGAQATAAWYRENGWL